MGKIRAVWCLPHPEPVGAATKQAGAELVWRRAPSRVRSEDCPVRRGPSEGGIRGLRPDFDRGPEATPAKLFHNQIPITVFGGRKNQVRVTIFCDTSIDVFHPQFRLRARFPGPPGGGEGRKWDWREVGRRLEDEVPEGRSILDGQEQGEAGGRPGRETHAAGHSRFSSISVIFFSKLLYYRLTQLIRCLLLMQEIRPYLRHA